MISVTVTASVLVLSSIISSVHSSHTHTHSHATQHVTVPKSVSQKQSHINNIVRGPESRSSRTVGVESVVMQSCTHAYNTRHLHPFSPLLWAIQDLALFRVGSKNV